LVQDQHQPEGALAQGGTERFPCKAAA
jgi:hypothetical protein